MKDGDVISVPVEPDSVLWESDVHLLQLDLKQWRTHTHTHTHIRQRRAEEH